MTDTVREREKEKEKGSSKGSIQMTRQSILIGDVADQAADAELQRFSATERLSEPYTLVIEMTTSDYQDFLPMLGLSVGVDVYDEHPERARTFIGRLVEARFLHVKDARYHYQLTAKPLFSLLDLNLNTRVFQNLTALEVIKKVLGDAGVRLKAETTSQDMKRGYCNQYRESDFTFVSRLMEEEGFFYYFDQTASGEVLTICSESSSYRRIGGLSSVTFKGLSGSESQARCIWEWSERISPVPGKVTLTDHHFLLGGVVGVHAKNDAARTSRNGGGGPAHKSELYDYPGGVSAAQTFDKMTPAIQPLVQKRLDSVRAEQRLFTGETDLFGFAAGAKFGLEDHPHEDWAQDYMVVGTTHSLSAQTYRSGEGGGDMLVTLEAISVRDSGDCWRPPLRTPKPVVAGPTTAMVVGDESDGSTYNKVVWVDEHGRVLVRFAWDRTGTENAVWIRVSQAWAGGGYGMQNIPRVGTEVVIDFMDGDPDLPFVSGRLHSDKLKVPNALPANKTQSTWKTQTVGKSGQEYDEAEEPPSGIGFNEIRLDDKEKGEEIYVHAQRDRKDWTRRDEAKKVGRDMVQRIGRDRKTEVKRHETTIVEDGDETRTLKKGSRVTTIKKADTLKVETGDLTTDVDGGNAALTIAKGNQTTTVSMGNVKHEVKLGKMEISAMQEIVIKVGPTTKITLKPTGIDIEAMMIKVKGSVMTEIEGGVMTKVKGGVLLQEEAAMVMIN